MKKKIPQKSERPLTPKQLKFIAAYKGNGVEAARIAGYSGNDETLYQMAYENLRKPRIRAEIKRLGDIEIEAISANKISLQKFWDKVTHSPRSSMKDRLKASELLGKSKAVFVDVQKITGEISNTHQMMTEQQAAELYKKLKNGC